MEGDDTPTIDDAEEAAWAAGQRDVVVEYLQRQRVDHLGVSAEPRWFRSPYVAVWAVRSKANSNAVGWWAISGDLPTDYMTAADQRDDGDVLIAFAERWRAAAEQMRQGKHLDGYIVGDSVCPRGFAMLLAKRAELLQTFGEQIKRGELK